MMNGLLLSKTFNSHAATTTTSFLRKPTHTNQSHVALLALLTHIRVLIGYLTLPSTSITHFYIPPRYSLISSNSLQSIYILSFSPRWHKIYLKRNLKLRLMKLCAASTYRFYWLLFSRTDMPQHRYKVVPGSEELLVEITLSWSHSSSSHASETTRKRTKVGT